MISGAYSKHRVEGLIHSIPLTKDKRGRKVLTDTLVALKSMNHQCYPVTRICKVIITNKKIRYLDWLGCWSAGLADYGTQSW